jgi:hypothetical protein
MTRIGFVLFVLFVFSCKHKEKITTGEEGNSSRVDIQQPFPSMPVPYQLTDTALLQGAQTGSHPELATLVADSIKKNLFNGSKNIKYYPVAKIEKPKGETYLVIKAVSGEKKVALVIAFDKQNQAAASLPFLVPDDDPTTVQVSSIDNSYSITRGIARKKDGLTTGEGKDVFAYDKTTKQFSWIVTDQLDKQSLVVNPIDTLPKTNKLSGDYVLNKKNIVSVRDARTPNQIMVYIHTENEDGTCKGDLKGQFLVTSSSTAIYRQGGDPCVLQLKFTGSSVSIHEEQGCGNHRDVSCAFQGSFPKKKAEKPRSAAKKAKL